MSVPTPPGSAPPRERAPDFGRTLALYSLARLGIVAVVTGLLVLAGVPLLIALLIALIVALPLSMVLFRGLRARLDDAIAARTARRREQRDALRAELRGSDAPDGEASAGDAANDDAPDRDASEDGGRADPADAAASQAERPADGQSDAGRGRPGE